jgi:hypothetical protein
MKSKFRMVSVSLGCALLAIPSLAGASQPSVLWNNHTPVPPLSQIVGNGPLL